LLVRDDDTGLARVSSGAFKDKELSIHIESALREAGRPIESCLQNDNSLRLVSIKAKDARAFNQAVCRDPTPEDSSHGLIYGSKNNKKISEGLRTAAIWIIPPSAPSFEYVEAEKRVFGLKV